MTVHVYEGAGTGGKEVATLKATPASGKWSVAVATALVDGKYTAQATQVSSLGNAEGKTEPEEFEIFTKPPAVKVTTGPEKRSKQNKPSFEGTTTAGETEPVTVHVYEGAGTGGKEVATLKATPASGKWSVAVATALVDGKYTAQATQVSSLGNAEGKTEPEEFEIFTKPPTVEITQRTQTPLEQESARRSKGKPAKRNPSRSIFTKDRRAARKWAL